MSWKSEDMGKIRGKIFEMLLLLVAILFLFFINWFDGDKYLWAKLWSYLTLWVIYGFFRLRKQKVIFSPINLFCFYYVLVVVVNYYYMNTDFEMTPYLEQSTLHNNYIHLFNLSCFYYFVGLVSIILGFNVIKTPAFTPMKFESEKVISTAVLKILAIGMMGIGLLNFFYNVLIFAGGNPLRYLAEIAQRGHQFENDNGSTLGYVFYFMGSYLIVFSYLRANKKIDIWLVLTIFGGVILWISNGRISGTIFYLLSFVGLYYYYGLISGRSFNNKKFVIFTLVVPLLGLTFYFFRLLSGLNDGISFDKESLRIMTDVLNKFSFYIIDKGNMPNTAIFLKVIDSWKIDHGYMYGQSLISWVLNILPSSLRPVNYTPSALIKEMWFSYVPGGHLPPTGVAEMYINFGPLGPFIGMFFLGIAIKIFYAAVIRSSTFWNYLILVQISFTFVMIYPKGELDNLNLIYVFLSYIPLWLAKGVTWLTSLDLARSIQLSGRRV